MGVPYQVYALGQKLDSRANLILVSADKSQTMTWHDALRELGEWKTIARIVVDEAHIPLIAKGYRKSLAHFYNIHSEAVPLVLLSATLLPTFVSQARKSYQLLSSTMVYRRSTNRKELAYTLEKMLMDETGLVARAIEVIRNQEQSWKERDRALIYIPSVMLCMGLAQDAGWHYSHLQALAPTKCPMAYTLQHHLDLWILVA